MYFCEQSRNLLKAEVVTNFLNQTGVPGIDTVVQAACRDELETLQREPEPYFWDLALLYALVTNETAAIGPLLNKRTFFAADDESNDARLQKERIMWQIRLAFDRKEKECASFVFACTELYSNAASPSLELIDWLTACWNENKVIIDIDNIVPSNVRFSFLCAIALWACKTGRMSLLASLFSKSASGEIQSFGPLEIKYMLNLEEKYNQYEVIEYINSKLKQ